MCGRFTLISEISALQQSFPWASMPEIYQPRYNIAPSQPVAVLPNNGRNQIEFYTWGLVPAWAKDPSIGNNLINARGETLSEKPSFRNAFAYRRCLILSDGFFEWKRSGNLKIPMYIRLKSEMPFAFAGLWDRWESNDGSEILSCTIITTEPNSLLSPIHNRMPVILPPNSYEKWLKPEKQDPKELIGLLQPYPAIDMKAYQVSHLVNNPKNDAPECISQTQSG